MNRKTTTARQGSGVQPGAGDGVRILEWKQLTGPQIDALDRDNTVLLVSCSPLEVHGPHLPTMTDNAEAEGLGFGMVAKLAVKHPEITWVQLPPIFVAADVLPMVGSVMFRASTIIAVLSDMGRSLCKQGFKNIWVTNFHGGPRHFVAIEVACDRVNRRHGGRMLSVFSLLLKRLTGGGSDLTQILGHHEGIEAADLVGDSHGGAVETSLMLHLHGEHVDKGFSELPRRTVDTLLEERGEPPLGHDQGRPSLKSLLRGFKVKIRYFETSSYSGAPGRGSAQLGERFLDTLAELSADALSEVWRGELGPDQWHSPLWKVRWAFTSQWLGRLFELAVGHRSPVW
jgi:creatinine amidohydrolase